MLAFLLQTQPPASPVALAGIVLSAIALLVSILQWLRRESREDGQTVNQRLKKLETRVADHDALHTGQQQAREKLADSLGRDIKEVAKDASRRCDDIERRIEPVPAMQIELAELRAAVQRLSRIEEKLDHLTEILTRSIRP